jgi:hypothetical protein
MNITKEVCAHLQKTNRWSEIQCGWCLARPATCQQFPDDGDGKRNERDYHPEQEGFIPDKR